MDAYKLLLWTTDPLWVLIFGAMAGVLSGFALAVVAVLVPHSRNAQIRRETAFLEREGRA